LLQEIQAFRNEAGIPAVNELRNAGYHLLQSLPDGSGDPDQMALASGVAHIRRATYEATEAGILFAVSIVRKFQQDYATVELHDLVADYAARCRACNEALRLVEANRQDGFDRAQDHANRIAVFRAIRPFADDVVIARVEANKRLAVERRDRRRFVIGTLIAVAGIVLAAGAILTAIAIG
jgi:hypothetical protein